MNLLLDTHLLLWAAIGSEKLSAEARNMINNNANRVYFSAASIWEVVIKNGLATGRFSYGPLLVEARTD